MYVEVAAALCFARWMIFDAMDYKVVLVLAPTATDEGSLTELDTSFVAHADGTKESPPESSHASQPPQQLQITKAHFNS